MDYILKNAKCLQGGSLTQGDYACCADGIVPLSRFTPAGDTLCVDCGGAAVFPGFADAHVHLREPGFSYKETIYSGSRAAAHGGYTAVCAMPNLNPVPDSLEGLAPQAELIRRDAVIPVYPYASITVGEKGERLSDMPSLAPYTVGFSDDGKGVASAEIMEAAMYWARRLGRPIVAHCEDASLLLGGYINDCDYARKNGHRGICSRSEWGQLARDLELVKKTGCAYHACHISTAESVALIRRAKSEGLDVTCETAPHYLLLDDSMLCEDGSFKMNPPLRSPADRAALMEGIADGTVDMISTDHAPHSAEEKSGGLRDSLMGIVGLETAFALLYTELVMKNKLGLDRLVELMSAAPRRRFGLPSEAGFTVFDLSHSYEIDPAQFLSAGKSTPFEGWEVFGRCRLTAVGGKIAYNDGSIPLRAI